MERSHNDTIKDADNGAKRPNHDWTGIALRRIRDWVSKDEAQVVTQAELTELRKIKVETELKNAVMKWLLTRISVLFGVISIIGIIGAATLIDAALASRVDRATIPLQGLLTTFTTDATWKISNGVLKADEATKSAKAASEASNKAREEVESLVAEVLLVLARIVEEDEAGKEDSNLATDEFNERFGELESRLVIAEKFFEGQKKRERDAQFEADTKTRIPQNETEQIIGRSEYIIEFDYGVIPKDWLNPIESAVYSLREKGYNVVDFYQNRDEMVRRTFDILWALPAATHGREDVFLAGMPWSREEATTIMELLPSILHLPGIELHPDTLKFYPFEPDMQIDNEYRIFVFVQ